MLKALPEGYKGVSFDRGGVVAITVAGVRVAAAVAAREGLGVIDFRVFAISF